jgi:hypothetical protein
VYQVFWHPKEMLMAGEERLPSPPSPGDLMMLLENPAAPRPQASRTLSLSLSLLFSASSSRGRFSLLNLFSIWALETTRMRGRETKYNQWETDTSSSNPTAPRSR